MQVVIFLVGMLLVKIGTQPKAKKKKDYQHMERKGKVSEFNSWDLLSC